MTLVLSNLTKLMGGIHLTLQSYHAFPVVKPDAVNTPENQGYNGQTNTEHGEKGEQPQAGRVTNNLLG